MVAWLGVLSAMVLVAVVVQIALVVGDQTVLVDGGERPGTAGRLVRFFSYFTIQSNLLVVVAAVWLIVRPTTEGRLWRVLRLDSLIGITLTGIIYATLLAPIVNLSGAARVTDVVFHYVCPVMAVLGWLVWGPRPRVDDAIVRWSLLWPALYVGYTLIHGAISDWYPYPFIDVTALGYGTVLRNGVGIVLLMLAVGMLLRWLDGWLPVTDAIPGRAADERLRRSSRSGRDRP